MGADVDVAARLQRIISDALTVQPPARDLDLIGSGLMDSLALVSLIVDIESELEVELPLEDFDIERFRTVDRIAAFVAETRANG